MDSQERVRENKGESEGERNEEQGGERMRPNAATSRRNRSLIYRVEIICVDELQELRRDKENMAGVKEQATSTQQELHEGGKAARRP